jgi:AraC-like DNA-binding protein
VEYFSGLRFGMFNALPACDVWFDASMPFYALNFVYAGRIPFRQGGARWTEIEGPAAFWTRPGVRYVYGVRPPDTWNHLYVTFSGPRASRMLRSGLIPARSAADPGIPVQEPEVFRRGFEGLHRELARSPQGSDLATHLLEGLFLQLHRQASMQGVERDSARRLRELISSIENSPAADRDFVREAGRLGWSPDHFRRVFRRATGRTPVAFHNRARLDLAAGALRTTDHPIKAIAERCGLPDLYYFSKLFKRAHGLPPGEYRRVFQLRAARG